MNDRAIYLLEDYDIEVQKTRKGRGCIICETSAGPLTFMEYRGNVNRLPLEKLLLEQISLQNRIGVDRIFANKEDNLYVTDGDGVNYILKTYHEGRECNIKDRREAVEAMGVMARLHQVSFLPKGSFESINTYSPTLEYQRHNRELRHIFTYLKKRGQKQYFERRLLETFPVYMEKALEVSRQWEEYESMERGFDPDKGGFICHGDFRDHNLIKEDGRWTVIHFEKWIRDSVVRDISLFMRKLLEKNEWSASLGRELLRAYEEVSPLTAYEYIDLYYRLAYPEKFWKIANFYYNTSKAFISERNQEKLEQVIALERRKEVFLEEVFQTIRG